MSAPRRIRRRPGIVTSQPATPTMAAPAGPLPLARIEELIGPRGYRLETSHGAYGRTHPTNAVVFSGVLCIEATTTAATTTSSSAGELVELWRGDLDLSLIEDHLRELSEASGKTLYLFLGHHFDADRPTAADLDQALYSITPTGHSHFSSIGFTRDRSSALRLQPELVAKRAPPPPRWRWRLLRHRPRLWRFWKVETTLLRHSFGRGDHGALAYLGRTASRPCPFLVLELLWNRRDRLAGIEVTWYPADRNDDELRTRSLVSLRRTLRRGRLLLWWRLVIWQGKAYSLEAGFRLMERP